MRINLTIHLEVDGNRIRKEGSFTVRKEEDIPGFAYEWVKYTKKETGYRKTIIKKVILDNEHDITDHVRQLDDEHIPEDDLPF